MIMQESTVTIITVGTTHGEQHIQYTIIVKHIMDMCKMLLAKYNTQQYTRLPHQRSTVLLLSTV